MARKLVDICRLDLVLVLLTGCSPHFRDCGSGPSDIPTQDSSMPEVSEVEKGSITTLVAGGSHTCVGTTSHGVYCWGLFLDNFCYLHEICDVTTVHPVRISASEDVKEIIATDGGIYGVTASHELVSWGQTLPSPRGLLLGAPSRLGFLFAEELAKKFPEDISMTQQNGLNELSSKRAIPLGFKHARLLGSAESGVCFSHTDNDSSNARMTCFDLPDGYYVLPAWELRDAIEEPWIERITSISDQGTIGCVLIDGGVRCWWGIDSKAPGVREQSPLGEPIGAREPIEQMELGPGRVCFRLRSGDVQCTEFSGMLRALAHRKADQPLSFDVPDIAETTLTWGNTSARSMALAEHGAPSFERVGFSSSHATVCVLRMDGGVECRDADFVTPPRRIALPAPATALASGDDHFCAVLETDDVACWGSNLHGQLGLEPSETYSYEPHIIPGTAFQPGEVPSKAPPPSR